MRNRDMSGAVFVVAVLLALFAVGVAQGSIEYSTQTVALTNGTGAVPSLFFSADPLTGLFSPGANQLGIAHAGFAMVGSSAGNWVLRSDKYLGFSDSGNPFGTVDTTLRRVSDGVWNIDSIAFASLGTPANGSIAYCSDCTFANPCAGSGTGAIAKRLNGAWRCD